jgi:vitamin B12 transporter
MNSSFFDSHIGIPFNGSTPSPARNQDTQLSIVGAEYERRWSDVFNLSAQASFARRDLLFRDPEDLFAPLNENGSNDYRLVIQNNSALGSVSILTVGFEQEWQEVTGRDATTEILNETIRSSSVFAQNKLTAGKWILTAGGRFDHHNSFGGHISPRVSAAYRLTPAWKLRGSAGTAFRAPSAGELAYPFYGNHNLKPEKSRSLEAGTDLSIKNADLSISVFYSSYRDLITFDPVTFVAANIDRASTRGLEAAVSQKLSEHWKVIGTYTLLFAKDDVTKEPLVRRPKHSGSMRLHYSETLWDVDLNFTMIGKRYERDFSASVNRFNHGYLKADVAASWRIVRNLRLTARIENFLDQEYQEALAFPAPGITAYAGLRFNL